jgi:hypothetical protein
MNCLPRLISNCDPLHLSLPSNLSYRHEPPVPGLLFFNQEMNTFILGKCVNNVTNDPLGMIHHLISGGGLV